MLFGENLTKTFLIYNLIVLGISIVAFVFKALGVYKLCKRKKIKFAWLSLIPFANTYKLGQITGDVSIISAKLKFTPLFAMLSHFFSVVLNTIFQVFNYLPLYREIKNGAFTLNDYLSGAVEPLEISLGSGIQAIGVIGSLVQLAYILIFISILFTLFRNYRPQSSFMFTLFSVIFDISGFFIFAIRNNKEIDYNAYMKERYAKMYSQNPNPYQNPYGTNPYNSGYGGNNTSAPKEPDDPFKEFANNTNKHTENEEANKDNDDPFSDFGKHDSETKKETETKKDEEKNNDDDQIFH